MADMLYKYRIDVPATLNKCKSLQLPLDPKQGQSFRISKMWIQVTPLDAIAAADTIGVQFSTKNQNEDAALLDVDDEYEIFTKIFKFHLAEAAITSLVMPDGEMEVEGIDGTFLSCDEKNYVTQLVTGQAGATNEMAIKILGGYTGKDKSEWKSNKF